MHVERDKPFSLQMIPSSMGSETRHETLEQLGVLLSLAAGSPNNYLSLSIDQHGTSSWNSDNVPHVNYS